MNIGPIREALANALNVPGGHVSPYVSSQPTPPGIQIPPPAITYSYSMNGAGMGLHTLDFAIQGFVSLNSDIGAQKILDDMCALSGPTSVRAQLELDKTLGGVVETLEVTDSTRGIQVEQPPGNPMLLVEWHVTITAKGN